MTFEPEFEDLMRDAITLERAGAKDLQGKASYATAESLKCRLVRRNRMVRRADGEMVVSSAQAWVSGAPGVTVEDRVTLPDGSRPALLAVEQYPDGDGPHHERLLF